MTIDEYILGELNAYDKFFFFFIICFLMSLLFKFWCVDIVIAGMERFAFKGVASNLVTYLTDVVKMSNSTAAKTVNSWCGFTSMVPLFVAPLADSCWDRYSTILASSFLYVIVSYCPFVLLSNLSESISRFIFVLINLHSNKQSSSEIPVQTNEVFRNWY